MVVVWQVQGDKPGLWNDYDAEFSARLEDRMKEGGASFIAQPGQRHAYIYDVRNRVQTHVDNNTRRTMRRVHVPRDELDRTGPLVQQMQEHNDAIWAAWERERQQRRPPQQQQQQQQQPGRGSGGAGWQSNTPWRRCGDRG
jgi:hypothetical protein